MASTNLEGAPVVNFTDSYVRIKSGVTATLDASNSYDPDGDPLTFAWSVVSKPAGSTVNLIDNEDGTADIVIQDIGIYIIEVSVTDGTHTRTGQITVNV